MLCERVFFFTSPYTCTLCPMFSLDPSLVGLASTCTCWWNIITRLCAPHTCVTWSAKILSFFPSCTSSFLVWKSLSTTDSRSPTTKLISSNSHFGAAALSALMILFCCSFTSASFASRNPSSLSVDCLNSKNIYGLHICIWLRPHLVPCPRNDVRKKLLDRGCTVSPDFFGLVLSPLFPVPSLPTLPCCRFLETLLVAIACFCYFLCQAWQTWACIFASVQHACHIQVPPDGVAGSCNCRYYPFAAWTVDVTVCFSCQTVSALSLGLSRYSAQLTTCWFYLVYFR